MKTRRGQRYKKLRDNGFCKFEARPLSRVPIKTVPYMRGAINERRDMFRRADGAKMSVDKWRSYIREHYIINKFMKMDRKGQPVADPWAFLRDFEDRYRAKNPAYESPWEKRRRNWVDFLARIERTIATQRFKRSPA